MNVDTVESPVVALARFIGGTITEKCQCDECEYRRELVTQLIYARNIVSEKALAEAF